MKNTEHSAQAMDTKKPMSKLEQTTQLLQLLTLANIHESAGFQEMLDIAVEEFHRLVDQLSYVERIPFRYSLIDSMRIMRKCEIDPDAGDYWYTIVDDTLRYLERDN